MPTEAFEEALDLRIGLLEAVAPASPYPRLRPLGREETRTFGAVRLENASLRATILPGLGGRILSILDKRTGTEILPPPPGLVPTEGGRRGVRVTGGVQLRLDGDDRPNDLGPVDFQIEEPPEAVWLAESAGGTGLSFHLRIELPPERAELRLEARVLNRTRRPLPYNGALTFPMGAAEVDGEVVWSPVWRAGLRVRSDELEHANYVDGQLIRSRFSEVGTLGPRQVDVWSVVLTPFSGFEGLPAVSDDVAAYFDGTRVQVQAVEPLPGARLLLGLADGQTLEAPADLEGMPFEIPLERLSADPVALAVQDQGRADRLRTGVVASGFLPTGGPAAAALPDPDVAAMDATELRRLTFSPAYRALAHLELGHRDLAGGGFADADARLETALLYNADDPLNWWAKAMARRLGDTDDEEGPELPNAHYLAPLEPALRAEAFLAQSSAQGREPNPLVAPLADRPESLIEVACLLLEIGVRAEASRWIDEALRHRDLAMLRYLAAWSLLGGSRMEAEAATFVAAAGRLPFEPPYPWREIERQALTDLRRRFPDDARLEEYAGLVLAPHPLPPLSQRGEGNR